MTAYNDRSDPLESEHDQEEFISRSSSVNSAEVGSNLTVTSV